MGSLLAYGRDSDMKIKADQLNALVPGCAKVIKYLGSGSGQEITHALSVNDVDPATCGACATVLRKHFYDHGQGYNWPPKSTVSSRKCESDFATRSVV